MKLLVTGAGGMLAADVLRAAERAGHQAVTLARTQLDVTDSVAVMQAFAAAFEDPPAAGTGSGAAINCAAWTDVDGAETHRDAARAANRLGAANVATAAAAAGVPLVHVSTDYVFDGTPPLDERGAPRPYVESDPTGPRTVYGQTKLEGERLVLDTSRRHTVVRSSWLFGVDGANFVATMLRLAAEQPDDPVVRVVTDQVGCPTWTGHLAPALIGLLEREVRGLVHLAGGGHTSWHGFAREIFRQAEVECRVEAATSEQMARPAPRPAWSALASDRADVLPIPDWRDGLAGYLAARAGMMRA